MSLGAERSPVAEGGPLVLLYIMESLLARMNECFGRVGDAVNQVGQLFSSSVFASSVAPMGLANGLSRMQYAVQSVLDLRKEIRTLCISKKESRGLELLLRLLDHSVKEFRAWAENIVSTLNRIESEDLQGHIQVSFTLTLTAPQGVTAELEAWGKNITNLYLPQSSYAPMSASRPMPRPRPGSPTNFVPRDVPTPAKQKQISCFWVLLGLIGLSSLFGRLD